MAETPAPPTWRALTDEEWDRFWEEHNTAAEQIEKLALAAIACCGPAQFRPELRYDVYADEVRVDLATQTVRPDWSWTVEIQEVPDEELEDEDEPYAGYTVLVNRVMLLLTPFQDVETQLIIVDATTGMGSPALVEVSGLWQGRDTTLTFWLSPYDEPAEDLSTKRVLPKYDNPN